MRQRVTARITEWVRRSARLSWRAQSSLAGDHIDTGTARAAVTFVIVLLALALTGWVSAQISDVHPVRPIVRTAAIGAASMAITYAAGHLFYP
jgi:hypothetical protein